MFIVMVLSQVRVDWTLDWGDKGGIGGMGRIGVYISIRGIALFINTWPNIVFIRWKKSLKKYILCIKAEKPERFSVGTF